MSEARRLAEQELAEVEWAAGLIDMPEHLRERGRRRTEFYYEARLKPGARLKVGFMTEDAIPTGECRWEKVPLREPFYEVREWGKLVERGPLPPRPWIP